MHLATTLLFSFFYLIKGKLLIIYHAVAMPSQMFEMLEMVFKRIKLELFQTHEPVPLRISPPQRLPFQELLNPSLESVFVFKKKIDSLPSRKDNQQNLLRLIRKF